MHAVHIPVPATSGESREQRIQRVETGRRGAQVRLAELRATLGVAKVRTRIRAGSPAAELTRAARETEPDVIIVGEPGSRQGLGRLRDTTVELLLRRSPVPVLLARASADKNIERILVAVDESPRAEGVIEAARRMANGANTEVTVLHVVSEGLAGVVAIAAAERERRRAVMKLEQLSATRVGAHVAALRTSGIWAEALCVTGDPAPKILEVASSFGADLIVLGLRRPGRLERALVGVIAHDVLARAPCSVLVVTSPTR